MSFIQIDTGRIGGITTAKVVADYAAARGVTYVNHTFTTHLALSAALQPFAGLADHWICEYPVEASELARRLTRSSLALSAEGQVQLPEAPGLGIEPDLEAIRRYRVDVRIMIEGSMRYQTPSI